MKQDYYLHSEKKYFEKLFIHSRLKTERYNLLPVEVIQAGLDVGIIIVHLVLVEGCFWVECCQCLLELHKLGLSPLSVASLVANVLFITSFSCTLQIQKLNRPNNTCSIGGMHLPVWTKSCLCTFDMSLMRSWYLLLAVTRPACSRLRRFLRIFLFFCSRGSWLSSSTAGLLFRPSGVWASWTARRSTTLVCSDSFRSKVIWRRAKKC